MQYSFRMAARQLQLAPSTNLESASYDKDTQQLTCLFRSGGAGYYSQVPEDEALAFERSPSPGKYVHEYLKPRFVWTRLA